MSNTDTTDTLHFHCGFDCYKMHTSAASKCASVGHFDSAEPCLDDCREGCQEQRTNMGITL